MRESEGNCQFLQLMSAGTASGPIATEIGMNMNSQLMDGLKESFHAFDFALSSAAPSLNKPCF
jgi:hypothetical protein